MVRYSNGGLKTGLKKACLSPVFEWSAKSLDFTFWIPDTHTVWYSDQSGIQVFGIQMVIVCFILFQVERDAEGKASGFKFSGNDETGSWSKRAKLNDYDEYQSIQNELSRYNSVHNCEDLFAKPPTKMTSHDTESSDDEFSLQDIGGRKAVADILDDSDEEEDDEDDVGLHGHHDAMFASDGDPDSVQVTFWHF